MKKTEHNIPLSQPSIGDQEIEAVTSILRSGWVAHGPKCKELEKLFCDFFGVRGAVLVNSCATALEAALIGLDIKGEVILPSFTMSATANAVCRAGAMPVFCDVEWQTGNLDMEKIEEKITSATEAIMPVHFAGQPCKMDQLMKIAKKHHLAVIEDSAECIGGTFHGQYAGTFGDAGCYSFWATKNITTGEGGVILSNDTAYLSKVRSFIAHGIASQTHERETSLKPWQRDAVAAGTNYRMSDIAAAIGVEQLKKLNLLNKKRREHAEYLSKSLGMVVGVEVPTVIPGAESVWQMYVIKVSEKIRDNVVFYLRECGIGASVHFDPPVHLQTYYKNNFSCGSLPITEELAKSVITLPLYPGLSHQQRDYIVETVRKAVNC